MPLTAAKEKSPGPHVRDEGKLPPLRVRYNRQMKPHRVYAVEVSWQKTGTPPRAREVSVRLLAPGAQVVPAEQALDDGKAVFYVTPLARGWLPGPKLEVLVQGRVVQEISMPMKVVSQRAAWLLLLLTFLVPWFISEFVKHSPMAETTTQANGRVVYRKINREVWDQIADNVPSLPAVLKDTPVETGLWEGRIFLANRYQDLVEVCQVEPVAFYAGTAFLTLALISAFLHKQKRRTITGPPVPAAAA
jgi:hypothetical protein